MSKAGTHVDRNHEPRMRSHSSQIVASAWFTVPHLHSHSPTFMVTFLVTHRAARHRGRLSRRASRTAETRHGTRSTAHASQGGAVCKTLTEGRYGSSERSTIPRPRIQARIGARPTRPSAVVFATWHGRQSTWHFASSASRRARVHIHTRCETFRFGSTWSTSSSSLEPHRAQGPCSANHSARRRAMSSL
jgi:hypothetical protein